MNIETLYSLGEMIPVKNYPKAVPLDSACPTLYCGLELEIENVMEPRNWLVPGVHDVEDGSLRNMGREFILAPMTFSNTHYCLNLFFNKNKPTERNYSERTSIHVHSNCRNLSLEKLRTILLLYGVFESMFYRFSGGGRSENIFCIPWSQTLLTTKLLNEELFTNQMHSWQKYTGLNLLPLTKYGTIEWRHLPGTSDLNKIMTWLNLIGCLYTYADKTSFDQVKGEVVSLNTSSQYEHFLGSVFGKYASNFEGPTLRADLEKGVLDIKYALLDNKKDKKKPTYKFIDDMAQGEDLLNQANIVRELAEGVAGRVGAQRPIEARQQFVRRNNFFINPINPEGNF